MCSIGIKAHVVLVTLCGTSNCFFSLRITVFFLRSCSSIGTVLLRVVFLSRNLIVGVLVHCCSLSVGSSVLGTSVLNLTRFLNLNIVTVFICCLWSHLYVDTGIRCSDGCCIWIANSLSIFVGCTSAICIIFFYICVKCFIV